MLFVVCFCLFLHKLTSNKPGIYWTVTNNWMSMAKYGWQYYVPFCSLKFNYFSAEQRKRSKLLPQAKSAFHVYSWFPRGSGTKCLSTGISVNQSSEQKDFGNGNELKMNSFFSGIKLNNLFDFHNRHWISLHKYMTYIIITFRVTGKG